MSDTEVLNFDAIYMCEDVPGGRHLATEADVKAARKEEEDHCLLLSPQADKFVKLVCLHGYLPSQAYAQAFAYEDEAGRLVKPDLPAYQARMLMRQFEIKEAIEEQKREIREHTKTEAAELEMTYRSIMMSEYEKTPDRIAAAKALSALRGFDVQAEGGLRVGTISIVLPFSPQPLGHQPVTIEGEVIK